MSSCCQCGGDGYIMLDIAYHQGTHACYHCGTTGMCECVFIGPLQPIADSAAYPTERRSTLYGTAHYHVEATMLDAYESRCTRCMHTYAQCTCHEATTPTQGD